MCMGSGPQSTADGMWLMEEAVTHSMLNDRGTRFAECPVKKAGGPPRSKPEDNGRHRQRKAPSHEFKHGISPFEFSLTMIAIVFVGSLGAA